MRNDYTCAYMLHIGWIFPSYNSPLRRGKNHFVVLNSVAGGHLATQRKQRCSGISCFPSHPCCVRYHPCCHGTFTSPRGIGGVSLPLPPPANRELSFLPHSLGPLSSAWGFVALGFCDFVPTKCKILRGFSNSQFI